MTLKDLNIGETAVVGTMGELVLRAWAKNVQAFIEGPGHVPMTGLEKRLKRLFCKAKKQVCV